MCRLKKHILFYVLSIVCFNVTAQQELKFERYTINQGLVQNYVNCIFQDDYGFMWFGTRDGISRFDGISFKNYSPNNNDSCSMLLGWVQSIQTDGKNRLWIGSGGAGGLMSYDYRTDCFTKHKLYLPDDSGSWNENFSAILCDNKGMIWTTLSNRLIILNPDTKETILVPQKNKKKIPEGYITFIYEDRNSFIWIGTSNDGLFKYNKRDSVYFSYRYNSKNPNTISNNFTRCIYEDSRGNIWIGTDKGGLNRYMPQSPPLEKQGSFEKFFHNPRDPNSLSHNTVYSICEDAENNLWIGTLNGLCLFDRDSKKFHTYYYDDRDTESLNDNIIRSLYCDKFGNLWVGTRLGVAKLKRNRFKTYNYSSNKNSLSHNKVDYLFVDEMQNIFVCTPVGIDYFDRKDNTFQVFKSVGKEEKHLSASPICMASDHGSGYWIGTYNGGVYYYDRITKEYVAYTHNKDDSTSLGNNDVFSVCVDSENTIWIGNSLGVNVFDKNTGKFIHCIGDFKDNSKVFCLYEDRDKNIWAGTTKGLHLLDKKEKRFKYYSFDERIDAAGETLFISCLYQDENKNLWIGTATGLYKINTNTGKKTLYLLEDGLPSLRIRFILEDKNHAIWVSTKSGLARFIPHAERENAKKELLAFKAYGKEDGLQSELIERSGCKLNDGTIAFGGSQGLSIFHPDSIKEDTSAPGIAFTNLKIFNKPVSIGKNVNGKIILEKSFLTTDTINIHYQNNNFTIEFAALHYRNSELNQYAYKLEGYDKEWNYTQAQNRHATYTDLPYKTYTFLLKASNSDGIWSKEIKKLTIHVLPPWWLTLWFKIFAIIVIVFSIIFWVKLKTHKLSKQKKILEERVEHRTRQLKEANQILEEGREELQLQTEQLASMNEKLMETNTNLEAKTIEVENMAKVVHEADQSKLRFFANISHEFRTPLSLIIAPLEKLSKLRQPIFQDKIDVSAYHQLMFKNAKRLLRLINQVVDFRKIDQGEKKLRVSNNNIEEFVKGVFEVFSVLAEQKGIDLTVGNLNDDTRKKIKNFWFDTDVMEKIFYNLVSNAIKYTAEGGNVSIQLSVNNKQSTVNSNQLLIINSSLLIKIRDTGIGIKKENIHKIYDRFYRVDNDESFVEEGTGIGLAYTKELVELHKGTISVESELGKGSTFILQFPIGKEHFEKCIIGDKPTNVKLDYIHSMIEVSGKETNTSEAIEVEEEGSGDEQDIEKSTILIVEDNADLRKFLKEELEAQYNVLEAGNGEQGWEMASETDIGLIVSDIMMPVMDGVTLCKKIKVDENTSHIPVILLTAKTGDENTIEGLETGADDYITKPFNFNVLKIKINNLFRLRKQMREKFSKSIDFTPSEIGHSLVDKKFMEKAIGVIKENMKDPMFDNEAFINSMDSSRTLVYKKIKFLTGQSIGDFIRNIRLKAAAQLFIEGNNNIAEVCYKVGFKHQTFFTRHFSKMFGKTPGQFLKEKGLR